MAKKKEDPPPAGSPAWMATFSDLMNLLLCFFVLLFSMSSVDAEKYEMVVNSLSSAFSILESGGSTMTDGVLISSGISQMPDFSNYFGDTLTKGDGEQEVAGDEDDTGMTGEDDSQGQDIAVMSEQQAIESYQQQELEQSEEMAQKIEQMAAQYGIQDMLEVDFNGQYVRITMSGALLFDSASAEVNGDALPLIEKLAQIINIYNESIIEVEGHTDNVPSSGKYESNDVLSMYRALSVADYLRSFSTVDPANIVPTGRGEYVPVADNSTAEGRARNRRVEIKIYNALNSTEAKSSESGDGAQAEVSEDAE